MTASRASGIVASALASAKQDGINYSEHVADRVLEALEAKGLAIVEKADNRAELLELRAAVTRVEELRNRMAMLGSSDASFLLVALKGKP